MLWPGTGTIPISSWAIAIAALLVALVAALFIFLALRMKRRNDRLGAARAKRGWYTSVKELLAELQHRGVPKVAMVYVAIGWVALEVLHVLFYSSRPRIGSIRSSRPSSSSASLSPA